MFDFLEDSLCRLLSLEKNWLHAEDLIRKDTETYTCQSSCREICLCVALRSCWLMHGDKALTEIHLIKSSHVALSKCTWWLYCLFLFLFLLLMQKRGRNKLGKKTVHSVTAAWCLDNVFFNIKLFQYNWLYSLCYKLTMLHSDNYHTQKVLKMTSD